MADRMILGDFQKFGAHLIATGISFTFDAGNAKKVAINIYEKKNKILKDSISLSKEFAIGNVYSVVLTEYDASEICYLYELDNAFVVDPYATIVLGRENWNDATRENKQYQTYAGIASHTYEWKSNRNAAKKSEKQGRMVYRLHMRGFTMNHSLKGKKAGTFEGVLHYLDTLEKLGVTTLEFFPLYEFEEIGLEYVNVVGKNRKITRDIHATEKINYWGYGTGDYFAPKASYFGENNPENEMKQMVDELHRRGMECIMDIYFAENLSDSYVLDVLRFWVLEYHIDGFHFVGTRFPMEQIITDPYLQDTLIFAGQFPMKYLESEVQKKRLFIYNDDFLYAQRALLNHKDGNMQQLMNQMRRQNEKYGFINYVANSNGFTLYDSVAYDEKHNEANGENNADGCNYNGSFNYGVEGDTKNKEVLNMRFQQMRNAICMLYLSQGVPLLLSGDERANSQLGNNNPYCQDNEIGWVSFAKGKRQMALESFAQNMAAFRKEHDILWQEKPYTMTDYLHIGTPDVSYHGSEPWLLSIGDERKAIGIMYKGAYGKDNKEDIYVAINYSYDTVALALPHLEKGKKWHQVMNTAEADGAFTKDTIPMENQHTIDVLGQSITILVGI